MAVVKYGSIVTEIKGKVGGSVFQGGISGPIVGNKAHLSISSVRLGKQQRSTSDKLITQHNNLGWAASNWKSLSSLDRAAWDAAAISFPFKNKFGDMYTGSGFQVYMQMNINSLMLNMGLVSSPPTPAILAVAQPFTIGAATDPNTFSFETVVDANTMIIVYATSPISPGLKLVPSMLKAIAMFGDSAVFPFDITAAYKKVFGTIPSSGFTWWQCKPTSLLDWRPGIPVNLAYSW